MKNELVQKIERITLLANQIKAELDDNFIGVDIDFRSHPEIFMARYFDTVTCKSTTDYFKEAFPDYEVKDLGHNFHKKLSVYREGVEIFILEKKEENNG